jgi:hypothetical protein
MSDLEATIPSEIPRLPSPDRFGNFRSGKFLISPHGKDALTQHKIDPQLLFGKIDHLREMLDQDGALKTAHESGMELQRYEAGEYSRLYRLDFDGHQYIVKIPSQKHHTPHTPYSQHMLQKQAIAKDLETQLSELQITVPKPLIASDDFYLEEYTEGRLPYLTGEDHIYDALNKARGILSTYLQTAKQKEPEIWANTGIEIVPPYERIHTMRVRPDGMLSWVAPVFNTSLK